MARLTGCTGRRQAADQQPERLQGGLRPDAETPEVTTYQDYCRPPIGWQVYTGDRVSDSDGSPITPRRLRRQPAVVHQQNNTTNSRTGGPARSRPAARSPAENGCGAAAGKTRAAYVLSSFINDVKNNKLPSVGSSRRSYCGTRPTPPFRGHYVNTNSRRCSPTGLWKTTALCITYDEHDGFFDHLSAYPEVSVADEYIGGLPVGPGPGSRCSSVADAGGWTPTSAITPSVLRFLAAWTSEVKPTSPRGGRR
jgi:phospholipase C